MFCSSSKEAERSACHGAISLCVWSRKVGLAEEFSGKRIANCRAAHCPSASDANHVHFAHEVREAREEGRAAYALTQSQVRRWPSQDLKRLAWNLADAQRCLDFANMFHTLIFLCLIHLIGMEREKDREFHKADFIFIPQSGIFFPSSVDGSRSSSVNPDRSNIQRHRSILHERPHSNEYLWGKPHIYAGLIKHVKEDVTEKKPIKLRIMIAKDDEKKIRSIISFSRQMSQWPFECFTTSLENPLIPFPLWHAFRMLRKRCEKVSKTLLRFVPEKKNAESREIGNKDVQSVSVRGRYSQALRSLWCKTRRHAAGWWTNYFLCPWSVWYRNLMDSSQTSVRPRMERRKNSHHHFNRIRPG